jgi:hypothetical protein
MVFSLRYVLFDLEPDMSVIPKKYAVINNSRILCPHGNSTQKRI